MSENLESNFFFLYLIKNVCVVDLSRDNFKFMDITVLDFTFKKENKELSRTDFYLFIFLYFNEDEGIGNLR